MIFKSILIAISIIQLSVCHPVSNDISYCEFKYTDGDVKYITIDCKGNAVYEQMCNNLQMDASNGTAVCAVTFENCVIDENVNIFSGDEVEITRAVFLTSNTFPNADFSSADELSLLVITEPKFQMVPSTLQVEASELKWFEYDGKDDEAIDSIIMNDPVKLEFFSMEKTSVSNFPNDFFKKATNLKMVRVPSNKIESIDAINWPNSMKWLDISVNKIAQLSSKSFENLEHLNILSVKENNINDIESGTFSKLNHLMYLSMQKNNIQEIKKGMLDGLIELVVIDLDENKIENIEAGAFEVTPKLAVLSLSENKISHVNESTFNGMTHLRYVDLSWNPIEMMTLQTFANMSKLENLDLSYCKLKSVDFNAFANTMNMEDLDLSHNKIDHLIKMSSSHPTKNSASDDSNSTKSAPFGWMGSVYDFGGNSKSDNVKATFAEVFTLFMTMDISLFDNSIDWKSLSLSFGRNEIIEETWKLETLTLSANQLTVIEKDVFAVFKNMKELYLSNNPITTLYPESFAGLNGLRSLYMNGCKLTSIDFSMFAHMTKLQNLDLSHNQLAAIIAAPMPSVMQLYMNDNQLTSFPMQKKCFPNLTKLNVLWTHLLISNSRAKIKRLKKC